MMQDEDTGVIDSDWNKYTPSSQQKRSARPKVKKIKEIPFQLGTITYEEDDIYHEDVKNENEEINKIIIESDSFNMFSNDVFKDDGS